MAAPKIHLTRWHKYASGELPEMGDMVRWVDATYEVESIGSMGVFLRGLPIERFCGSLTLVSRMSCEDTVDTHRHHVEEHLGGAHQPEPEVITHSKDVVLLPHHYTRFKIEPIYFIAENGLDFMTGNVIKYVCRHDAKNGVEDLRKARRYLDMIIKRAEGDPAYAK